jgi:hypothetical protein
MELRMKEAEARPKLIEDSEKVIAYVREMLANFTTERPWIPEKECEKLANMTNDVEEWMTNMTTAQELLAPHEAPAFLCDELRVQLSKVSKVSSQLLKRPKPKEEVKKDTKKKDKKKKKKKNMTEDEIEAEAEAEMMGEETPEVAEDVDAEAATGDKEEGEAAAGDKADADSEPEKEEL